jgi:hypothetical protein
MKRSLLMTLATFTVLVLSASAAQAQSGHFVGAPTYTDIGTQVRCTQSDPSWHGPPHPRVIRFCR